MFCVCTTVHIPTVFCVQTDMGIIFAHLHIHIYIGHTYIYIYIYVMYISTMMFMGQVDYVCVHAHAWIHVHTQTHNPVFAYLLNMYVPICIHSTILAYLLHTYTLIQVHAHKCTPMLHIKISFSVPGIITVCPSKKLVCVVPSDIALPDTRLSLSHVQCHWNVLWLSSSWDSPIHYLAQELGRGDSARNNSGPTGA